MAKHGTVGCYDDGCRCDRCKEANAARKRNASASQKDQRVEVEGVFIHPHAPHGTLRGYQYYGCRCGECKEANNERGRKYNK